MQHLYKGALFVYSTVSYTTLAGSGHCNIRRPPLPLTVVTPVEHHFNLPRATWGDDSPRES